MRTSAAAHHLGDPGSEGKQASPSVDLSAPGVRGSLKAQPALGQVSGRQAKTGSQKEREADVLERLWGWRICDRCGQTMMLGEGTFRMRLDKSTEEVCVDCAGAPRGPSSTGSADGSSADPEIDPAGARQTANDTGGESL